MKPKILIIIGVAVLGIILLVIFTLSRALQQTQQSTVSPTPFNPVQVTPFESSDYQIISSTPANREVNVSTSLQTLRIRFNKALPPDGITVSFYPVVASSQVVSGDTVTVTTGGTLQPGVTYSYTISFNETVVTQSFTTTGPTPTTLPDTRPENFFEEVQEENKIKRPDIYIANLVPYTESSFYIESVFKTNPDRYSFKVTLLGSSQTEGRNAVQAWLLKQGLTQSQIDQLEITYE